MELISTAGTVMNGDTIQKMLVKGSDGGDVRFAYANSLENLREGMARMERWLAGKARGSAA